MYRKHLAGVLYLLLFAVRFCLAGDDANDAQMLASVSQHVSLPSQASKPFQLDADFTAHVTFPQTGHLTWKWAAKDLWSQEIVMGDYRELKTRKGENLYINRSGPFTPRPLGELPDLMGVLSLKLTDWQVKKIKHEKLAGATVECIEIRPKLENRWKDDRSVCLDESTLEARSYEIKNEDESVQMTFEGYAPFDQISYPRVLKKLTDGSFRLQVNVVSLRNAIFDADAFTPPAHAILRRQCEGLTHPLALNAQDAEYPPSAVKDRKSGTTIASVTVLADGSVGDVEITASAGREMDESTQKAIKRWKFKPAMCGSDPVVADIQVTMSFQAP